MKLDEKEVLAVKIMMLRLAEYCREDLIGAVLYTGVFRVLNDDETGRRTVELSDKLRLTEKDVKIARKAGIGIRKYRKSWTFYRMRKR